MAHKNSENSDSYKNLWRDMFFIAISLLVAFILVQLGLANKIVSLSQGGRIVGSFLSGVFFTSAFTIAPAAIALAELAKTTQIFVLAFWGALGAMLGDMILFLFIRDRFADDLEAALHHYHDKKLTRFFHRKFFRWLTPLVGALVIMSPLPDELGITMMGVAKIRTWALCVISFTMNFLCILLLALAIHSL
jgi:hypothetical protein